MSAVRSAMTFTEVLVVVAIVSILAAITYRLAEPAREEGRQTVCANQLRQIYGALQAYAADDPDFVPIHPEIQIPYYAMAGGTRSLSPYVGREVFFCPNSPPCLRTSMSTTYTMKIGSKEVGPVGDRSRERLDALVQKTGQAFPLYLCHVHEETYYAKRSQTQSNTLNSPHLVVLRADGAIQVGKYSTQRLNLIRQFCK